MFSFRILIIIIIFSKYTLERNVEDSILTVGLQFSHHFWNKHLTDKRNVYNCYWCVFINNNIQMKYCINQTVLLIEFVWIYGKTRKTITIFVFLVPKIVNKRVNESRETHGISFVKRTYITTTIFHFKTI